MDFQGKENGRLKNSTDPFSAAVFEPTSSTNAKERGALVEWLNSVLPNLSLPINASDEELRASLIDGTVLCRLLNKLKPGSVTEGVGSGQSSEYLTRFLSAMDEMNMPRFQQSDLEKGSMKLVLECLLTLKTQYMSDFGGSNISSPYSASRSGNGSPFSSSQTGFDGNTRWKHSGERYGVADGVQREELSRTNSSDGRWKVMSDSKLQRALRSPVKTEPSTAVLHHFGHKFHEVFQLKQGGYADIPAAKISEMMKSNSLDSAPTQSLLSVVNGILDESVERQNGEIPYRVACLLRKVVQEIERRISTQAEHLRTQNNLFKAREEKYQSRIRVLEALARGTSEETQVVMNQLQQIKSEKTNVEEKKRVDEQDMVIMMKEKDDNNQKVAALKQELDTARNMYEQRCLQMEKEARGAQQELEERLKEVSNLLSESRNRVKQLETFSESKSQRWTKKEHIYQIFTEFQLGALRELKFASQSIKQEVLKTQKSFSEEFNHLALQVKALQDAAQNYYAVLAENRKLHNELQELKGNIRVYCRIRPFLPGQTEKQSTIEYIGENGELIVVSPSKSGKEGRRSFKFNKVYSLSVKQAEVFSDIQPLIQSVLDGYNVCIFAYGQTGSGKTYTMMGPERATEEQWGINYRALNDLFRISQTREGTFTYEIGAQMVEIYNEQVRDLLSSNSSQKSLGILATTQPNGLAVPDASMYPVNSTSDVLELMDIGLKNRAKGSTALNERSSRSHSVVTIHIRGTDLKTGSTLRSSLHLVDLAGSERVDRSEVTGDRLKEAQHINKSLSALGDVIFALAQKSPHVPYRNSKLTQVLQSSLGGQAKTLMFVQLNPEVASFSETVSTLKFAERVSGVELGAAKSSKDGRDVRELMEQVSSLKDKISKKDEEIERLQLLKDIKNAIPGVNGEKRVTNSLRYGSSSSSSRISSLDGMPDRSLKFSGGKGSGLTEKAASDQGHYSDSDKHSIASSHNSNDDIRGNVVDNLAADV